MDINRTNFLSNPTTRIDALQFSPCGQFLASAVANEGLFLYSMPGGLKIFSYPTPSDAVFRGFHFLAKSQGSTDYFLVTISLQGYSYIIDTQSLKIVISVNLSCAIWGFIPFLTEPEIGDIEFNAVTDEHGFNSIVRHDSSVSSWDLTNTETAISELNKRSKPSPSKRSPNIKQSDDICFASEAVQRLDDTYAIGITVARDDGSIATLKVQKKVFPVNSLTRISDSRLLCVIQIKQYLITGDAEGELSKLEWNNGNFIKLASCQFPKAQHSSTATRIWVLCPYNSLHFFVGDSRGVVSVMNLDSFSVIKELTIASSDIRSMSVCENDLLVGMNNGRVAVIHANFNSSNYKFYEKSIGSSSRGAVLSVAVSREFHVIGDENGLILSRKTERSTPKILFQVLDRPLLLLPLVHGYGVYSLVSKQNTSSLWIFPVTKDPETIPAVNPDGSTFSLRSSTKALTWETPNNKDILKHCCSGVYVGILTSNSVAMYRVSASEQTSNLCHHEKISGISCICIAQVNKLNQNSSTNESQIDDNNLSDFVESNTTMGEFADQEPHNLSNILSLESHNITEEKDNSVELESDIMILAETDSTKKGKSRSVKKQVKNAELETTETDISSNFKSYKITTEAKIIKKTKVTTKKIKSKVLDLTAHRNSQLVSEEWKPVLIIAKGQNISILSHYGQKPIMTMKSPVVDIQASSNIITAVDSKGCIWIAKLICKGSFIEVSYDKYIPTYSGELRSLELTTEGLIVGQLRSRQVFVSAIIDKKLIELGTLTIDKSEIGLQPIKISVTSCGIYLVQGANGLRIQRVPLNYLDDGRPMWEEVKFKEIVKSCNIHTTYTLLPISEEEKPTAISFESCNIVE